MTVPEDPGPGVSVPGKKDDEALSAERIVQAMVKAAKGMTIYPPGSSFHARFVGDLHRRLVEHLDAFGPLSLEIEHYEIRFGSHTVYENRNLKESLAFRIHADGIASLEFREGLPLEEIRTFLGILNSRGGDESDDDMVTLLWSAELPHVAYELEDDLEQGDSPLPAAPQESSVREEAVKRVSLAEETAPMESPLRRESARDILALTVDEEAFLAKAIAFEETKNPLDDILDILPAMIEADETESFRKDIFDLTGSITSRLLSEGLVDHALALLGLLKAESERRDISGDLSACAAEALAGVGASQAMESPEGFLQAAGAFGTKKIVQIIDLLGPDAARPFCLLLGTPLDEDLEGGIVKALARLAGLKPEVFLPFLSADDPALAKKILSILGRAPSAAASEMLPALAASGDASLQREVMAYIGGLDIPGGEKILLALLDDEKSSIRIHAARALAAGDYPAAGGGLIERISAASFRERGPAERKVFSETLGRIGGEKALSFLKKSLGVRYPFARKKEREDVLCAAAGLRMMASPEALDAIVKERDGRKGDLRDALDAVARRLERSVRGGEENP